MSWKKDPSYLVVGSGRVARHIKRYFGMKEVPYLTWNRKEHSLAALRHSLRKLPIVLLLIKDSAIEAFYREHLKNYKGKVVHFSGSLHVPGIESFHPLMTFGPKTYSQRFYEKIHFAGASKKKFRAFFPALNNPVFELNAKSKPFYHALCVMSGNFPHILWRACLSSFKELGVPAEALALYLRKNLDNFAASPENSLTGPLVRGDMKTIKKNLAALPKPMRELYKAFVDFHGTKK